jgi:hypothetical protein
MVTRPPGMAALNCMPDICSGIETMSLPAQIHQFISYVVVLYAFIILHDSEKM